MRRLRFLVSMLAAVGVLVVCAPSQAESTDDESPAILVGHQPSWFLMGGATGGASFSGAGTGGYLGAEVSLVRSLRGLWSGIYADGTYDFRSRTVIASLGPEFGYSFLGFDGGLAVRSSDFGLRPGILARLSANVGMFGLYGRYGYWHETRTSGVQVGATFKLPLLSPWGRGSTRASSLPW